MKIIVGLYTLIGQNAPYPVYSRVLSCILKPVLTYLYNDKDFTLSMYEPTALMKFLGQKYPEVNLLIGSLAKSGRLELLTGTYNHNVLTLMQPKDRSMAIEKTTTLIRRLYGQRASTYFSYGQIWTPSVISTLSKADISRTMISGYDATEKKVIHTRPFMMNDLGKKVAVLPYSDVCAKLVSSYGQNEISLDSLILGIRRIIENNREEELILMINVDQLTQGASFAREDDEKLSSVFFSIFERASELGYEFCTAKDINPTVPGCLDEGWYGRDVYTCSHKSFRQIFVQNGNYRYLLNRAIMVLDEVASYKKDHDIKRELQNLTNCLLSADLFLCNTHLSALKLEERRMFYRKLLAAEQMLIEKGDIIYPDMYDLNESGEQNLFSFGKFYTVVYSPIGGAIDEFDFLPYSVNIFDTVPSWDKVALHVPKLKSFTDKIDFGTHTVDYSEEIYDVDILNKAKTEFIFSYDDDINEVEICKHYKLRNLTLSLELMFINTSDVEKEFKYSTSVYFTLPSTYAFSYDSKRQIVVGDGLVAVKNVRFADEDKNYTLSFTATKDFNFKEEQFSQSEVSTLGSELLYLYTKGEFEFPIQLPPGMALSISIATRVIDNKEKKNVSTKQESV